MRKLNIRRMVSAALAVLLAMSLTVGAFAAEIGIPTDRPDLAIIAAQFVNWDGSYELPNLNELSEEDQELVKAMVNAAMVASEAEAQTGVQTEDGMETQAQTEAIPAETPPDDELLPAVTGFSDVPSTHGFYTAIMDCAAKGITSGYADGTFRPTNSVTKAQFSVMLSRAFYPDKVEKLSTDENKAVAWFYPNVLALKNAGVLKNTSFENYLTRTIIMNQSIPRYDMAQLMTNIMAAKGFSATAAQKTEAQKKISDYKSIPSQYQDAVKNVYALGIITGYSNGTFGGNNVMNRGQGCVVIYRMMKYTPAATKPSTGDTYDDGKTNPSTGTGNTGNTGTSTGNTGSSGSGNTGSGTGNTGTTSTTGVLANGKAITEANVLAIIQEMLKKYPHGATWGGNTTRPGTASTVIRQLYNNYTWQGRPLSTMAGCSGFASLVSDTIFGSGNANPAKKVPVEYIRPGDIIFKLNQNGQLMHVAVATSKITEIITVGSEQFPVVNVYHGNVEGEIANVGYYPVPKTYSQSKGYYVEVWTRYPTNGTPWTGSTSSGNTGAGSSSSSGSSTDIPFGSAVCGLCGTVTPNGAYNSNRTKFVCTNCYQTAAGRNYVS